MDNAAEQDWIDAKGRKVPAALVSDIDKIRDQTIDHIMGFAEALSAQIARFKGHAFDDVYTTVDLLREKYGAKIGGKKGNIELTSFDGCRQVKISVADHISFGPELQVAKELIDECIEGWSAGASDEIRALVNHAFETDKPGQVKREALMSLRRLEIKDETWQRAMDAISDSMRVVGSKEYVRIYRRDSPEKGWEMVPLNIAAV